MLAVTYNLINAIETLKVEADITDNRIKDESGVHNIKKILTGEITPTLKTWWKLRKSYPTHIPETSYIDGSPVGVSARGSSVVQSNRFSTDEQYYLEMLNKCRNRDEILMKHIQELLRELIKKE